MKQASVSERLSTVRLVRAALALGGILFLSATASRALAQSKSGFIYNGMDYVSYAQTTYLEIPQGPNSAQALRATGANYSAVVVTWYVQTYNSTSIAPSPSSPSDAAVAAAIQNLQAKGITVTLKPHVDSLDGIWRGNFTWPSSAVSVADQQGWLTEWFTSYQSFIMHFAQIASANGVGTMVIGTELKKLTGSDCAGTCRTYWDTYVINPLRAKYPNLTLAYGANANGAGDEFTTVSFWEDLDIIGVDGYFPLTNLSDPTVAQLVNAWTNAADNANRFEPLAALQNLQSAYDKPMIFAEVGYTSTSGSNQAPYNYTPTGSYDPSEQQNCYEAFLEVFSAQAAWMKGVFWWAWTVSPPGVDDTGYSPQNKPAGMTTLPEWYGSTTAGFTLAPSYSMLRAGQGLTTTDTISVTTLGGFSGVVNLSVTGLPAGVTASFEANPTATGISVLSLSASSSASTGGPATLTIMGTSGALTASTTIALTVTAPESQSISFANPGNQPVGTLLALAATASSGLPVIYTSVTASVCTVSGSVATLAHAGVCTIQAVQAGNYLFSGAPPVSESFQVVSFPPVPVPKNREVVVSQTNWLASLGTGGNAYVSQNPDGSSFAVNSNGAIVEANTTSLLLFDAQSGVSTTLGAWGGASAVAVDGNNDIYVGNLHTSPGIVRLPYLGGNANGGYAPFTTPSSSLPACTSGSNTECVVSGAGSANPGAMAFDSQGSLFWITAGNGANGIWECTTSCLAGTALAIQLYQEPSSPSSGQLTAGGLAIDSAGNIFFADSSIYVDNSYNIYSFFSRLNELPVSGGGNAGFAGNSTGYSTSPIVLYTLTPSQPPTAFGNEVDAVAIATNAGAGDIVYFGDQYDGVFSFPDTGGGMIPTANGQPTALHMVSRTGVKVLAVDSGGNLYFEAYSSLFNPGGEDSIGQITIENIAVPVSAVGAAASPSTTLNPVAAMLNDSACAASPPASVSFVANASTSASAALSAGHCSTTPSGGAYFPINVSFTPRVAGNDSVLLTGTDQLNNTGTVTVSGIGAGFTLSLASSTLPVPQGGSNTDTITIADVGGFSAAVAFTVSGLPNGVTGSFAAGTVSGTEVLTLTAISSASLGGPVTVMITGTSGSLSSSTTIAVTVIPSYQGALVANPALLAMYSGVGGAAVSSTFAVASSGSTPLAFSVSVSTSSGGNWLSATANSRVTPAVVSVVVNSTGLIAGSYSGQVSLMSNLASNSPLVVPIQFAAGVPEIPPGGIVNGASYAANLAPGSITSIFGQGLSLGTVLASAIPLPVIAGSTQVLVNNSPAPLYYVSPVQINFQMPLGLSGTSAKVQVSSGGVTGLPATVNLAETAPSVFSTNSQGTGQGAVLNADFSQNAPANPASVGSVIQIYCTGLGAVSPPLGSGEPGSLSPPFNTTVISPAVTIGGQAATVQFSAIAPGFVGLYQVNAMIPPTVAPGSDVPLVITSNGVSSNGVTIAVK